MMGGSGSELSEWSESEAEVEAGKLPEGKSEQQQQQQVKEEGGGGAAAAAALARAKARARARRRRLLKRRQRKRKKQQEDESQKAKSRASTAGAGVGVKSTDIEVAAGMDKGNENSGILALAKHKHEARHRMMINMNRRNLPPLPVCIRRSVTPHLHLANMSLGDDVAEVLAESLDAMPYLESLDVSDNRLTDRGILAILTALRRSKHRSVKSLNISQNDVDSVAAHALSDYIGSSGCSLTELHLCSADVDDLELRRLTVNLDKNLKISHLHLAHNLIGAMENMNVVQPDFITGGEALGEMLKHTSTIQLLNLSWNFLRLESAAAVGMALGQNYSLTKLDLSYNAFSELGVVAVGQALELNERLTHLDLSHNNVGSRAALVLANGVIANSTLLTLGLDGNPLGVAGGRAFMRALNESTVESRRISMVACNFEISGESIFDPSQPAGDYVLNMSSPYERTVAQELLRLANYRAGCGISNLMELDEGAKATAVKLTRPKSTNRAAKHVLGGDAGRALRRAMDTSESEVAPPSNNSNSLLRSGARRQLNGRGGGASRNLLGGKIEGGQGGGGGQGGTETWAKLRAKGGLKAAILKAADEKTQAVGGGKTLYLGGNQEKGKPPGLVTKRKSAKISMSRTATAFEVAALAVANRLINESTGKPYELPNSGLVQFSFTFVREPPSAAQLTSDSGLRRLLELIRNPEYKGTEHMRLIQLAAGDLFFSCNQFQKFFMELDRGEMVGLSKLTSSEKLVLCVTMLPRLVDYHNIEAMLNDLLLPQDRHRVERTLGEQFPCIMGNPIGHYLLDLDKAKDRDTANMLLQFNNRERGYSKYDSERGDTSQHRNFGNFRNETLNGNPIVLTDSLFNTLPFEGILELDYVCTSRPPVGAVAVHPVVIAEMMQSLGFVKYDGRPGFTDDDEGRRVGGRDSGVLSEVKSGVEAVGQVVLAAGSKIMRRQAGRGGGDDRPEAGAGPGVRRGETAINAAITLASKQIMSAGSATGVGLTPIKVKAGENADPEVLARTRIEDHVRPDWMPSLSTSIEKLLPDVRNRVLLHYYSADQVVALCRCLPKRCPYKSRLLVAIYLFPRVIDLENYHKVLATLTQEAELELFQRVGHINLFNPFKPDRFYKLYLGDPEQRLMVQILVEMAVCEPGQNWMDETFGWDTHMDIPGWELPLHWSDPDGLPDRGHLRLIYCSRHDMGCAPDRDLRSRLLTRCLLGTVRPPSPSMEYTRMNNSD